MKAIDKFTEISMYAGDATYCHDLLVQSERDGNASKGVFSGIKRVFHPLYNPIAEYIREDLCRSTFLLCLFVVVFSAVIYNQGYSSKQEVQRYLIQLEAELENERDTSLLARNVNELEAMLLASEAEGRAEGLRLESFAHLLNIKSYFAERPLGNFGRYYLDKINELETLLASSQWAGELSASKTAEAAALSPEYLQVRNLRYTISLLHDYAEDQENKSAATIARLETDARKALVGRVSIFNTMMDLALLIGAAFLILGISSIPGLGKQVKTGFV